MTDGVKPSPLPKPNKPGTAINAPKPPSKPAPNQPSHTIRSAPKPTEAK